MSVGRSVHPSVRPSLLLGAKYATGRQNESVVWTSFDLFCATTYYLAHKYRTKHFKRYILKYLSDFKSKKKAWNHIKFAIKCDQPRSSISNRLEMACNWSWLLWSTNGKKSQNLCLRFFFHILFAALLLYFFKIKSQNIYQILT